MKGVPIQSFSRAISALKAINRHGSMTMMEISRAAGVPYPTAHRIVQTLMYEGLVEQEPARKRYRPTALVQSLSSGYQQDGMLVEIARPEIVALTKKVGWPVSIAIRVGKNMMLRDSTHANTSLTFSQYYPGFTLPLLDSASGKLSMAYADDDEREQILKWMRADQDIDPDYLAEAEMALNPEGIRAKGYAVQGRNYFNHTPGKTSSIAVPIFNKGRFEAAMTLVYFVSAMSLNKALETYLPEMLATAQNITAGLARHKPDANLSAA
ncbi:helix-turn-helix domain-containing protein [Sphingomonas lacunae]|uniref:Helix-turn-helix domain-containing protein n=1 Tax=Sphingomonas lacunae TaxID=2698828 RepID=A0A6M4AUR9_9SPHN|nr:helix-turn-helix domain-containing protein [Sphingomonas lacunae]QJQ32052.1 helix-turn-helix domain-containing protein [Sphingomonas lacunae]